MLVVELLVELLSDSLDDSAWESIYFFETTPSKGGNFDG